MRRRLWLSLVSVGYGRFEQRVKKECAAGLYGEIVQPVSGQSWYADHLDVATPFPRRSVEQAYQLVQEFHGARTVR